MSGQIYHITPGIIPQLLDLPEDKMEALLNGARLSSPLFACMFGGDCVGIGGFIPATMLSDSAYVWFHHTGAIDRHRVTFLRHHRRLMEAMREVYPRLRGHCFAEDTRAIRWMKSLGAKVVGETGPLVEFTIGDE